MPSLCPCARRNKASEVTKLQGSNMAGQWMGYAYTDQDRALMAAGATEASVCQSHAGNVFTHAVNSNADYPGCGPYAWCCATDTPCAATQVSGSDHSTTGSITGHFSIAQNPNGTVVPIVCKAGYTGGGNAVCQSNGIFSTPACIANQCAPTQVAHSNKSQTGSITGTTGQKVLVTCATGYQASPGVVSANAVCQSNGTFTVPTCSKITCKPDQVPNSNYAATGSLTGMFNDKKYVTCNAGYTGSGYAVCLADGTFTKPSCV